MAKLYTIGKKESGFLFVKTDPLRAVSISREEIDGYATQVGQSSDEIFGEIVAACKEIAETFGNASDGGMVPEDVAEFGALFASGTGTADAEFCLVADVPERGWQTSRWWNVPIGNALMDLMPEGDDGGPRDLIEGELGIAGAAGQFRDAGVGTYSN